MPPWKPPWKSMEDPGEVSSYYPQIFPGHPRDLSLEYMQAGPPGVGFIAPMAAMGLLLGKGFNLEQARQYVSQNRDYISFYREAMNGKPFSGKGEIAKKMYDIGQWQKARLDKMLDERVGK